MATSFPTPKPSSYMEAPAMTASYEQTPMPSTVAPTEGFSKASIITPDCSPRDITYTSFDATEVEKKAKLLMLSKQGLAMSKGSSIPDREPPTLAPRPVKSGRSITGPPPSIPVIPKRSSSSSQSSSGAALRLNKFVRRLHDMLQAEKDSGIVEWRRGLLVLYSTDAFAKTILPKYFNTRNFKTFRRQLNYYGFVHVRSFSTTGSSTTALWVNRSLAKEGNDSIASVLKLKRVEPCEAAKTAEGRRYRKEMAKFTVEEDIGLSAKTLQLDQIRSMALRGEDDIILGSAATSAIAPFTSLPSQQPPIPREVHVPTDSSASNCGSSCSNDESEDTTVASSEEDVASASAANVLLMLSRS